MKNKSVFFNGVAAGIPIGLGYFAVSFSLGIVARKAGLNPLQGFIASFFNLASAGEYALFTSIEQIVTYIEVAVITFVVNARYLLMSCALSQRFSETTPFYHRFFVAFGITDEIFGVSIAQKGALNPWYNYGAMAVAVPLWSLGTSLGVIAGNMLPGMAVDALSVALYGMFIAIIIPPAKKKHDDCERGGCEFRLELGVFGSSVCKKSFGRQQNDNPHCGNFCRACVLEAS